ncbi:MAG: DUF2135 domain-containing protein [Treponema sp.]|nr:DUF2135 domain-containing protein [Treponema sp.]
MKKFFTKLAFVFLSTLVFAQTESYISMKAQDKNTDAIRLTDLSVNVEVTGNIALTTLDMIFQNTEKRILEGEFEFPLGENESITGYALDINGKMRSGVIVEKTKGRQVFEAVVRQGIDPGLVEKTAGNNFKTRIYPFQPGDSRHIRISYQSELKSLSSGEFFYTYSALPKEKVDSFDLKITVLDTNSKPYENSSKTYGINFISFDKMNTGWTAQVSKKNFNMTLPLSFIIPHKEEQNNLPVFTQDIGKDTYFYSYKKLNLPAQKKALPKKLTVWWDISSSGEKRNKKAELEFLKNYLVKLNGVEVTVIPFCNEVHSAKVFKNVSEKNISEFEKHILNFEYDGATNFGFDFTQFGGDEVLIFSDGLANWDTSYTDGSKNAKAVFSNKAVRVYTINSSASANHEYLTQIAQSHGGQYINLNTASKETQSELLEENPLRLIKADFDSKAVTDIFPQEGSIISNNFSVSGILKRKEAVVTLYLGHGNTVEQTVRVNVSASQGIQSSVAARQWALKKISDLNSNYETNKTQIISIAKKFSIVTSDTSLIVLDNVHDYVRYGIVPPESDTELFNEYNQIVSRQNTGKLNRQTDSIPDEVYHLFKEYKKWWKTTPEEFKKLKKPKKEKTFIGRIFTSENQELPLTNLSESAVYEDDEAFVQSDFAVEARNFEAAPAAARMAKSADSSPSEETVSRIKLEAWNPSSPYLSELKRTPSSKMYQKYLELKKEFGTSPAFYMEVSDYFAEENMSSESIRILSNLAELNLENTDILRALGNKLVEHHIYKLAVPVFEKLVSLKEEVPQFYRDLGLAYYNAGEMQKAVDTFYSVVSKKWDGRFNQVQQIVLNDMNAVIAECSQNGIKLNLSKFDSDLIENFDVDVRIVLTWNTDDCDVDLWVTDEDGEKCFYGNKLTANGARMSRDFTQGYGPEEFAVHKAPKGKLKIEANYFGSHQQKILQPVTVQAEVYTNFGRKNQKCEILTLQLETVKGTFLIGEIEF